MTSRILPNGYWHCGDIFLLAVLVRGPSPSRGHAVSVGCAVSYSGLSFEKSRNLSAKKRGVMSDLPRVEIDNLSVRSNPLKYLGYRDFTKLVAGSPDYFVLRKFETLAARTALYLQDVVAELEQRLVEMDEDASKRGETNINNGTFREDILDERIQLVRVDIPNALEKYCKYLSMRLCWRHS